MKNRYNLIGKITKITLVVYLVIFFFASLILGTKFASYEREDNQTSIEINDFNSNWSYNNSGDMLNKEEPLFSNARSAIDFAYNKFNNLPTKQIEIIGTMTISASIATIKVKVHEIVTFFENGDVHTQQNVYEDESNSMNFGQTASTERLYRNDGTVYMRRGKGVDFVNYDAETGRMYPAWTEEQKWKYDREDSFALYIFNNDTIILENSFEPIYNAYTGKIQDYKASVKLNTVTAVDGYDKQIQTEGPLDALPKWSILDFSCTLDRNATLVEAFIREEYSSKKAIPALGKVDYKSSDEWKLYFNFDPDTFVLEYPEIDFDSLKK